MHRLLCANCWGFIEVSVGGEEKGEKTEGGREGGRRCSSSQTYTYNAINSRLPLQGKVLATSKTGFFPSDAVRPCPCVSVHISPRINEMNLVWLQCSQRIMATIDVFVKECAAFQLNFSALRRLYFCHYVARISHYCKWSPPPLYRHPQ